MIKGIRIVQRTGVRVGGELFFHPLLRPGQRVKVICDNSDYVRVYTLQNKLLCIAQKAQRVPARLYGRRS